MADNETIADIIAEMRRGTRLPGYWRSCDVNKILQYHADRFEAAHRRERGDAAKLREALEKVRDSFYVNDYGDYQMECGDKVSDLVDTALAAPPRNCDLPKVVEDPWRAWLDDESNWGDGNPKLEIHDWLLAPATEKEGGDK